MSQLPESIDATGRRDIEGDRTDDDGLAIDSYFEAPSHQPLEYAGVTPETKAIPVCTRIITNTMTLVAAKPTMLFPPDANRKSLRIEASAAIRVGSGANECTFASTFTPSTGPFNMDGHTGAVWVYAVEGTPSVYGWAVTS